MSHHPRDREPEGTWGEALLGILLVSIALGLLLWAVLAAGAAPLPPRPPAREKAAKAGPITVAELRAVNYLHWHSKDWVIAFEADGTYFSYAMSARPGEGKTVWHGPWHLDGQRIILQEWTSYISPDSPPDTYAGPHEMTLELRRLPGGGIGGTGWNDSEMRLEVR